MSCRKLLCQECTTQWEGINYCRECVGARAVTTGKRATPIGLILMMMFATAMALALVRLAVGIGVYLVGMF